MRTKLFMLFVILIMALTNCKNKESYVEEHIYDTISVSNLLTNTNNNFLLEYIWDKRWSPVDPCVNLFLVPNGSVINYEVFHTLDKRGVLKKSKKFSTVTQNDFFVVNSDISFFPKSEFNNLLALYNRGKLIKMGTYKIYNFPMLMNAKEADEFIEFAPLNVWETKSGMPYFISSLEEWKQKRDWETIKDSDIIYFKRNGAMSAVGRREPLTIEELFRYHDPKSEAPIVYIKKDGELIALIGQEGKLWKKR